MVKRTTINLDMELVARAREVLEAGNTTETVHAALRDVVRREDLRRLTEWELEDLTLDGIKEMRRSRVETRPWGRWRDEFDLGDASRPVRKAPDSSTPSVRFRSTASWPTKAAPTNAPSATPTC
jgi:Arc/MetJ family transcription regulator